MSGDTTQPLQWRTFIDILDRLGTEGDERGHTYVKADGTEKFVGYATLERDVKARGRQLLGTGLRKGDRLALIIPDADDFVLTFLGAVCAGIVPVPLYPPLALGKLDAYIDTTARDPERRPGGPPRHHQAGREGPVDGDRRASRRCATSSPSRRFAALAPRRPRRLPKISPDDTLFLQFTSGSTVAAQGRHRHAREPGRERQVHHARRPRGRDRRPTSASRGCRSTTTWGSSASCSRRSSSASPSCFIPTLLFLRAADAVAGRRLAAPRDASRSRRTSRTRSRHSAPSDKDLAGWDLSSLRVVGLRRRADPPGTLRGLRRQVRAASASSPRRSCPATAWPSRRWRSRFIELERADARSTSSTPTRCHESQRAGPAEDGADAALGSSRAAGVPGARDRHLRRGRAARLAGAPASARSRIRGPSVMSGYLENPRRTREAFAPTAGCAPATSASSTTATSTSAAARRRSSSSTAATTTRRTWSGRRARSPACARATSSRSAPGESTRGARRGGRDHRGGSASALRRWRSG